MSTQGNVDSWRRFTPDDFGISRKTVEVWSPLKPRSVSIRDVATDDLGLIVVCGRRDLHGIELSRSGWTRWRPLLTEPPKGL